MRDMGPDAQINYSLHSSILSRQLPFIGPVRCPLRMPWEGKSHSSQGPKKRKNAGDTENVLHQLFKNPATKAKSL